MSQSKFPKLYLDQPLSERIAVELQKYKFDIITLHKKPMLSNDDRDLLEAAVSEQRAIVTFNVSDYVALNEEYREKNKEHWGIIVTTEESTGILIKRLLKLLSSHSAEELKNQIIWLSE